MLLPGRPRSGRNLTQPAKCTEVARLQLQCAMDIVHAFFVTCLKVVEGGSLASSQASGKSGHARSKLSRRVSAMSKRCAAMSLEARSSTNAARRCG